MTHYEYWPFDLLYFPVYFYYLFLAIKYRSFTYFTSSNPSIETGGFLGESKWEVFKLIPKKYLPTTLLFSPDVEIEDLEKSLRKSGIAYPFIAKPEIGERGWMVEKISNRQDLALYLSKIKVNFLIQELVVFPIELGVFYIRYPNSEQGRVTSIVKKGFLKVEGDGTSSVKALLEKNTRAILNFNFGSDFKKSLLKKVPAEGQKVIVESIGNHCRGTAFINANNEIDEKLNQTFDTIAKQIPGFYFGRFDLRCQSFEDLKNEKNFKIMELNGAGSEPGHIYDPDYSLLKAYRDIIWHFKVLAEISNLNKKQGISPWTLKQGLNKWKEIREYNRLK